MAFDELEDFKQDAPPVDVVIVDVLGHRALSRAIAERFNIRHESPQALLMLGGVIRWHASHYRITADAMRRAVASLEQPAPL